MTTASPQARQDLRPCRTPSPRRIRGVPGSPGIKRRRRRHPAAAPHRERPHLAQPAPRSRLGVSGDDGEGARARARAQPLCLRPVLAVLGESSRLAGSGTARSRHLPPLKRRRGYHRRRRPRCRRCRRRHRRCSGWEKTARSTHAPGRGAEEARARAHTSARLAYAQWPLGGAILRRATGNAAFQRSVWNSPAARVPGLFSCWFDTIKTCQIKSFVPQGNH